MVNANAYAAITKLFETRNWASEEMALHTRRTLSISHVYA